MIHLFVNAEQSVIQDSVLQNYFCGSSKRSFSFTLRFKASNLAKCYRVLQYCPPHLGHTRYKTNNISIVDAGNVSERQFWHKMGGAVEWKKKPRSFIQSFIQRQLFASCFYLFLSISSFFSSFCVFQNFFRGREHLIIFSGQFEPKNVPIFSREISLRKRNEQTTDRISLPFLCPINVLQKSSFFMLKTYLECSRLKIVRKIPSLFRC